jgi:hypothetical protein
LSLVDGFSLTGLGRRKVGAGATAFFSALGFFSSRFSSAGRMILDHQHCSADDECFQTRFRAAFLLAADAYPAAWRQLHSTMEPRRSIRNVSSEARVPHAKGCEVTKERGLGSNKQPRQPFSFGCSQNRLDGALSVRSNRVCILVAPPLYLHIATWRGEYKEGPPAAAKNKSPEQSA